MRRDWRAVFGMGVAFFALNGLTAAVLGPETFSDYFGYVVPTVSESFRDFWPNASVNGFFSKLLDAPNGHVVTVAHNPVLAKLLTGLFTLLLIILAGWKCLRARTVSQRDLAFAACIVAMLLVSPITWDHYFLLLILTWAILWQRLPSTATNRIVILATILTLTAVRPSWIWEPVVGGPELVFFGEAQPAVASPIHVLTVISFQFYTLLALFFFAWAGRPRKEAAANDED
jgi:hypothetical protein